MTQLTDRNRRDLHPDVIEENKEDITLIWLDKGIDESEDSIRTQTLLLQLNNFVQFYTNTQLCINYIQTIKNEKVLLIIAGSLAYQVLPEIHTLKVVNSIFIFCSDQNNYIQLLNDYSKIIGIYTDRYSLIQSIEKTIHLISEHLLAFRLFNQQQHKSTRDLSKDSASFLWNQLLIDTLRRMPQTEDAKNDMLNKCSDYYRTNQIELKKIELFRNKYTSDKAIEWYTRDSFVYRLVNKALRTEDIDLLYLFRFYIIDLCSQLEQESRNRGNDIEVFVLYRGQQISTDEFNRLKENIGVLISINGFFSSSHDINMAQGFIAGANDTEEMKNVVFQIRARSNLEKIVFANIDKYSRITDEQEVLFNIGSVFKIDDVQFDSNLHLWKIEMTATDDGSKNVQDYVNSIQEEIDDISPNILFGALLFNEMGQIDKSENYFNILLKTLPNNHHDIPDVYDQLANIFTEQGKLDVALESYTHAYELRKLHYINDDIHIATSLHNLGFIHTQRGESNKAMDYYRQVLTIDEKLNPNDHINKAHTMICIGMVYNLDKEYDFALDCMLKAYDLYQKRLPDQHPYISSTLWHIGEIYENKLEYDRACEFYHLAMDMNEKILPNDHPDFKKNLDQIIQLYVKKGDYEQGLNYCQEKLATSKTVLGENHPKIAHIRKKIDDIIEHSNVRHQYC